ncbi:MAG: P-loop NTPase [Archangium sp.]|nr:P-loop NTPase [Archangium sp.]
MAPVRVISVTSGKGGVGKSHLAVNVATLCARAGQRVLIFDADGGLSNVDVLLGVRPARHVGDLLDGAALDSVLHQVSAGLWLLAGAPGERRLAHLDDGARLALRCAWDALASRFDVVVVDVGAGVGDDVLFFTSAGQTALLVVTDEPTSLGDALVLLQALRQKTPVREVDVVVNCVRTERSAQVVFARLQQSAATCALRLRFTSNIPDDQNVRRAAMAGRALVDLAPTSPASRAFERLTHALLSSPARRPSGGPWLSEGQLALAQGS